VASPTSLTLKHVREIGYTAEVVEKIVPKTFIRRDLYGVGDILAVHPEKKRIALIQAKSYTDLQKGVRKALEEERLKAFLDAGLCPCGRNLTSFHVISWGQKAKGMKWTHRAAEVTSGDTGLILARVLHSDVPSDRSL
jgi:hypothetical protein